MRPRPFLYLGGQCCIKQEELWNCGWLQQFLVRHQLGGTVSKVVKPVDSGHRLFGSSLVLLTLGKLPWDSVSLPVKWECLASSSWHKGKDSVTDGAALSNFHMLMSHCRSVTESCPTLCDPMDCSTPGLPVPHHLLELAQTHDHWVGDAIQPSRLLSSPSPPEFWLRRSGSGLRIHLSNVSPGHHCCAILSVAKI